MHDSDIVVGVMLYIL